MPLRAALGCLLIVAAAPLLAQTEPPVSTGKSLTGRWLVTADIHGMPVYLSMDIVQEGEKISGTYGGQKLEGSFQGDALHFVAQDEFGGETAEASLAHGVLSGKVVDYDDADKEHPDRYAFTATLVPGRRPAAARRHEFVPSVFYREFSPLNKPVLTVAPGDTIHTTTVDAGGADAAGRGGVRRPGSAPDGPAAEPTAPRRGAAGFPADHVGLAVPRRVAGRRDDHGIRPG